MEKNGGLMLGVFSDFFANFVDMHHLVKGGAGQAVTLPVERHRPGTS